LNEVVSELQKTVRRRRIHYVRWEAVWKAHG